MGCGNAKAGQVSDSVKKDTSAAFKGRQTGRFITALPPVDEGRRDFARIFFANERKIFIAAPGMPSMRPLQPTIGPSSSHIGDLSEAVVERAASLFNDELTKKLQEISGTAPEPALVERLCTHAVLAMSVNVGLGFTGHMQLLHTFLQPFFLVVLLGTPLEARVATYGFVAERPNQILGDRPESKRTKFCVRLLSPDLLQDEVDTANWEVEYRLKTVNTASIQQAVESLDMAAVRESTHSGRWNPLTQV